MLGFVKDLQLLEICSHYAVTNCAVIFPSTIKPLLIPPFFLRLTTATSEGFLREPLKDSGHILVQSVYLLCHLLSAPLRPSGAERAVVLSFLIEGNIHEW